MHKITGLVGLWAFQSVTAWSQTAETVVSPQNAFANALMAAAALVIPVVGAMAVQALRKLAAKWDLQGTAQDTANMEDNIKASLNSGIAKLLPEIAAKGWDSPTVRAAILSSAAEYLQQRFPDRADKIVTAAQPDSMKDGLTDDDHSVAPKTAIMETLAGRLPDAIASAAASPATPPVKPTP